MKKRKRAAIFLLTLAIASVAAAGCGKKQETAVTEIEGEAITENTMPISDGNTEISIFLDNRSRGAVENYGDSEMMQKLQEITGIKIKFEHPMGSSDQLSLMLSSGEIPDVLYLSTYFYGGWSNSVLKKSAYDGMFMKLDKPIELWAPNLKKYLSEHKDVADELKMVNADGSMYTVPAVSSDLSYNYFDGYFIRKDWLDKLGLDIPDTIEDWDRVLRAFVDGDPNGNGEKDEVGFSTFNYMTKYVFAPAFDVYNCNYYLDPKTNRITHGVLEKGFKDYVEFIRGWYKDGIVNPEYASTDQKTLDYLVLNDKVGAFYCDNNNSAMKYAEGSPGMELIAVPFVKSPDGERRTAKVGRTYVNNYAALINAKTKYPEEIVRLFDYLFSEEGIALHNWGIEGESYTVDADGNKKFTDLILKNPDGRSVVDAYNAFTASGVNGGFPGVFDVSVTKALQTGFSEKQTALQRDSVRYCEEVDKSAALPWTATTLEEDEELAEVAADLDTYINEMYAKFITGASDMSEYDGFVENAKKLGLEKAVEIRQKAYERGLENIK